MPPIRTLAGIEVFFAPAELGQKTDFKSPLRGQDRVLDKLGGGAYGSAAQLLEKVVYRLKKRFALFKGKMCREEERSALRAD
ncbi:MAG: hypothetical protein J6A19_14905 [Oscillospiraceae bacterium]|nr:hypothetical protein [Oscillospiraceae bacterium]